MIRSRSDNREPCAVDVGPVTELEIALPARLHRFAASTWASVTGPKDAPAMVVMGGISSNRFPCRDRHSRPGWWSEFAGEGGAVDPRNHRIIGLEFIADESGEIAPSTRDQSEVIGAVLDAVGVQRAHAIVGASYGGMVALGFGEHFPARVECLVIVSASAEAHPTATAMRELQRRVVAFGLSRGAGAEGLALARAIAMMTYRCPEEFEARFAGGIDSERALATSEPGEYLLARGNAYPKVMSPGRFVSLSAAIDRHRCEPERIGVPALIIGSDTDQVVPPSQLESLASRYGGPVILHMLRSGFGHDMFLKQQPEIAELARPFLETSASSSA